MEGGGLVIGKVETHERGEHSAKEPMALRPRKVEAQQAQLTATADLFKALGGGWEANSQREEKSETEKVFLKIIASPID